MAGDNSRKEQSALSGAASAAGTARGAIKTGKAIAGAAKGAAAGPYGMLAAGLWENRKTAGKILAAFAALFMLPVLFLLMLPSLVFGSLGLDDATGDALNDNSVIMENIAETEASIEAILRKKHDGLLEEIQQEADALDPGCEYGITDDFSDRIIYESALIISQFCASQDDYREISLAKLERILRDNTDGIFTYTVEVTEYEETDEETGESRTIYHHEYTVEYAGDSYYAENVFHLTDEQLQTAEEYAANLHLFLFDTVYLVEINPDLIPGETGNKAVDLALTKLGTPYSQEKRNQEGYFDCSSFTYWVYSQLGVILQHGGSNTAASQGRYITENNLAVSYGSLAPRGSGLLLLWGEQPLPEHRPCGNLCRGRLCGGRFLFQEESGLPPHLQHGQHCPVRQAIHGINIQRPLAGTGIPSPLPPSANILGGALRNVYKTGRK